MLSLISSQAVAFKFFDIKAIVLNIIINVSTLSVGFGLPPTPPSSSPSDDYDNNQCSDYNMSSGSNSPMTPGQEQQFKSDGSRRLSQQQQQNSHNRNIASSSSRQPIHTPLISSQPVITVNTVNAIFIIIISVCVCVCLRGCTFIYICMCVSVV